MSSRHFAAEGRREAAVTHLAWLQKLFEIQKNYKLQKISDKITNDNIQMKEAAFWAASFPY